jgi:dual specificity phosphatase 3
MTGHDDITEWHRRLCTISEQIIISGDLSEEIPQALRQIDGWKRAGISHVLDTRIEWSDQELVAQHAPVIVYAWVGADDAGLPQADEWFDAGLEFATEALRDSEAVLLVHCHMGINRGPTMAYRILLERGVDPIEALDIIRSARPIADIGYAADALDHYHRNHEIPQDTRVHDRDRLEAWTRGYPTTGLHIVREPS